MTFVRRFLPIRVRHVFFLLFICFYLQSANASPKERIEEFKGKIVVVNFWASWCKPCGKEMPLLMELQRTYEERGVQFVGACTDASEDRMKADEFLRKHRISYPIWFGVSDEDMKPLGLGSAIPATAIFDRDGKRVFRLIGEIKKKNLIERLEWLLGNREGRCPKELLLPVGISSAEYPEPSQSPLPALGVSDSTLPYFE